MMPELFLQMFHVSRFVGVDHFGQPTYGAPEQLACRAEPSTKLLRNKDGGQSVSELVLFTQSDLDVNDLVFPPGTDPQDESNGRNPIRVERHFDLMSGQLSFVTVHL